MHAGGTLKMRLSKRALAGMAIAFGLALTPAAAVAQTPTRDGYGGVIAEVVTPKAKSQSAPAASQAPAAPAAAAPSNSTLPFTGLQVGAILLAGVALLGVGMLLRRFSASS